MARKYKRITFEDRKMIEKLYNEGVAQRYIALFVGVNESTIYRELRRCDGAYKADEAQKKIIR